MKKTFYLLFLLLTFVITNGQQSFQPHNLAAAYSMYPGTGIPLGPKLHQRNFGMIGGLQRGNITSIELGAEGHWRKISFKKPHVLGATANMEYNFGNHIIGYKAGMWYKKGRVNLTYGGNLAYYNDFNGRSRYGLGPAVGFRLAGFHLVNGYNFLAGDKELTTVNKLYMSLRYYFPVDNKFTWDKREKKRKKKEREKKKRKRDKEKERRKKNREKEREKEGDEKKGRKILGIQF